MALNAKQIAALNGWSQTQAPGTWGQVDGQTGDDLGSFGSLWDSGKMLNHNYRDEFIQNTITFAAPTGSTVTSDRIMFVTPTGGQIQSMQVVASSNIATTTTAGNSYTFAVRKYNAGVAANLTPAYDFQTGLATGVLATLPTMAVTTSLPLLTATSTTVSIGASSANITVTSTGALVNAPSVGDYISILSSGTNVAGTGAANAGIYQVTGVDPLGFWFTATKQFGGNPVAVAAVAVLAADVTAMQLVRNNNTLVNAGDMIGLQIVQAAACVSLANIQLTFLLRFRPA